MDTATAGLGPDRYFGMVERNACHFAPYSWHRWARFHEEATRRRARLLHRGKTEKAPLSAVDTAPGGARCGRPWLNNGYGDHFLQDSFAAGHLINKTLVMQWFVDYVNGLAVQVVGPLGRMWWGDDTEALVRDARRRRDGQHGHASSSRASPAATSTSRRPSAGTTARTGALGETATDPQTAWERRHPRGSGRRLGRQVDERPDPGAELPELPEVPEQHVRQPRRRRDARLLQPSRADRGERCAATACRSVVTTRC